MIAGDELLEAMRGDTASDWPDRLLEALAQAPLVDEADLDRANLAHDTAATLSPAELRALVACSHGLSAGMAADVLGLSFFTVKDHLKAARVKLGAKTTTHAICLALRSGVIE